MSRSDRSNLLIDNPHHTAISDVSATSCADSCPAASQLQGASGPDGVGLKALGPAGRKTVVERSADLFTCLRNRLIAHEGSPESGSRCQRRNNVNKSIRWRIITLQSILVLVLAGAAGFLIFEGNFATNMIQDQLTA